jgi:hypothetical protein
MLLLMGLSAVVWTIVGSVGYWARNGWLPADTAGWAQAIGAIVAIVVAIAIPYYQGHLQLRQKEEADRKQRLDGINATYALMNHVSGIYRRLITVILRDPPWDSPNRQSVAHDLKQSAAMLREIPVTALSNEMVHFLVGLREVSNFGEFMGDKLTQFPVPLIEPPIVKQVQAKSDLIDRWIEELEVLEGDVRYSY